VRNPAQHREAEGLTVATRIASTQPDVGDAHLRFCNREPLYVAGVSAPVVVCAVLSVFSIAKSLCIPPRLLTGICVRQRFNGKYGFPENYLTSRIHQFVRRVINLRKAKIYNGLKQSFLAGNELANKQYAGKSEWVLRRNS
jgi:hypothetical protein